MITQELRKATILVLAAAAAAKKRKKTDGSGNTSATGATTASEIYRDLERGFDTQYVVDGSEKPENCDVIFIDPAQNGKPVKPFKDMDFYFLIRQLDLNEMEKRRKKEATFIVLATKEAQESEYTFYDITGETYKEFARNHDRLHKRYVLPLYNLVMEGQSIGQSMIMQHDDLEL